MTRKQIEKLVHDGIFPDENASRKLIETHASWVILTEKYAFKIKKPVKFSFLDFSTPELRKHFCEEEVRLNRRLSNLYLGARPIRFDGEKFNIDVEGKVVDYAVQMQRVDENLQMDLLLKNDKVTTADIEAIAGILADFHQHARIITQPFDEKATLEDFADLHSVASFLSNHMDRGLEKTISGWIKLAETVLEKTSWRFQERVAENFIRDGHGDLHSRNIFLLEKPVIFDCIEFNEHFRINDVLSELAFLAMDLKRFGKKDFKKTLIKKYSETYACFRLPEDYLIFQYFLLYRSTVRLKIAALQLKEWQEKPGTACDEITAEIKSLVKLSSGYAEKLSRMLQSKDYHGFTS